MSIAMMQPYFLPYLGYLRLCIGVDKFIFLDNVFFINKGWINRNRLLINNAPHTFILPLVKASQNKLISELSISAANYKPASLLKLIYLNYKNAPYFQETYSLLEKILLYPEIKLVKFITHSLEAIFDHLNIAFNWALASDILEKNLKGEKYIIEVCQHLQAEAYVNASGGRELYREESFSEVGIQLIFLPEERFTYRQWSNEFIANLSILDVMMFNDKNTIAQELIATKSSIKNLIKLPMVNDEIT